MQLLLNNKYSDMSKVLFHLHPNFWTMPAEEEVAEFPGAFGIISDTLFDGVGDSTNYPEFLPFPCVPHLFCSYLAGLATDKGPRCQVLFLCSVRKTSFFQEAIFCTWEFFLPSYGKLLHHFPKM